LALQVICDASPGAESVTATYQVSNDGSPISTLWVDSSVAPNLGAITAANVPQSTVARSASTDPMGAFGRVKVACTTQVGVLVRVVVCGRVDV
jgi:hypothetical protein